MFQKAVGKRIRFYRKKRGLTQEKFAEEVGLSPVMISAIERGERTPSLESFVIICNVLQVGSDLLLTDVLKYGYDGEASVLSELLKDKTPEKRKQVFSVIHAMLDN